MTHARGGGAARDARSPGARTRRGRARGSRSGPAWRRLALALGLGGCDAAARPATPTDPPPLPAPVTNNAVAAARSSAGWALFSFMGLDTTKAWDGVTARSYRWDLGRPAWREIAPPPGPGRLAATAQTVGGRIFLFGGYTVAEDGSERSVPEVDVFDPETETWSAAAPMPVPVDDAVSGVWRDSLVILVSGWHDSDNVAAVQLFDPAAGTWSAATPIPGPPVFGHAGAVSGDLIVYIDGTRVDREPRRFALERSSWAGRIDSADPTRIAWERLPDHPGPGLYRAAAIGLPGLVLFAGGSDNPYNYDGIGYDGRPSEPSGRVFGYEIATGSWIELDDLDVPTMDHRSLALADRRVFAIGGMVAGRRVTDRVARLIELRR